MVQIQIQIELDDDDDDDDEFFVGVDNITVTPAADDVLSFPIFNHSTVLILFARVL